MFGPFKTRNFGSTRPRDTPFWALLIGETYASAVHAQARRRPYRAMLPDVDFSRRSDRRIVASAPDDSMGEDRPNPYVAPAADSDNSEMPGSMRPLAA